MRVQRRIRENVISISSKTLYRTIALILAAIMLFGGFRTAANNSNENVSNQSNQSNNQSSNSGSPTGAGSVHGPEFVPQIEENKPAPKVVTASVRTSAVIKIPTGEGQEKTAPNYCNCLQAINKKFNKNFKTLNGFAASIPVVSTVPDELGFVITYESFPGTRTGHIAHYYKSGDNIVIDWEANYERCKMTSGRVLPIGSPLIKGYLPN